MIIKRNKITDSLDKNTVTKNSIPDSFQYIKKDYALILSKARFTIKRTKLFIDNTWLSETPYASAKSVLRKPRPDNMRMFSTSLLVSFVVRLFLAFSA